MTCTDRCEVVLKFYLSEIVQDNRDIVSRPERSLHGVVTAYKAPVLYFMQRKNKQRD